MTLPKPTILFDFDGTLVDSLPDIHSALVKTAAHFDLESLSQDQIIQYIGPGIDYLIGKVIGSHPVSVEEFRLKYKQFYRSGFLDQTRPYNGVETCVSSLCQRGVQCGIVTNKPAESTMLILDGLGMTQWFDVVIGPDIAKTHKPDPYPITLAMDQINADPLRTLFVGDTQSDITAAKQASIPVVAVSYGYRSKGDLLSAQPDYLVDAVSELMPVFDQWLARLNEVDAS